MRQFNEMLSITHHYPAKPTTREAYPAALVCADGGRAAGSDSDGVPLPQSATVVEIAAQQAPRFQVGRLMITSAAAQAIPADEAASALARHAAGDWGNVPPADWTLNDEALRHGGRLFSVYQSSANETFWIITESDRRITTLLLPGDY